MNPLTQLIISEIGLLLLACTRLSGVLIAAPLGWDVAPARVRAVLVIALGLFVQGVHPQALAVESLSVISWMLYAIGEFILGAGIGLVVRIAVSIAEIAAESFSPIMGLGAAQIFDPQSASTGTMLSRVFKYLMVLLALLVGVHRIVIGGVMQSFRALPVGAMDSPGGAAAPLVRLVSAAIESGVRIAIPILALLFMTQAALAFISRAAPAMQIFSVGFAVTLAVGAVALILVMPDVGRELLIQLSYVGRHIDEVGSSMFSGAP